MVRHTVFLWFLFGFQKEKMKCVPLVVRSWFHFNRSELQRNAVRRSWNREKSWRVSVLVLFFLLRIVRKSVMWIGNNYNPRRRRWRKATLDDREQHRTPCLNNWGSSSFFLSSSSSSCLCGGGQLLRGHRNPPLVFFFLLFSCCSPFEIKEEKKKNAYLDFHVIRQGEE